MKALKSLIFCLIVCLGVSSYAKAAPLSQIPRILYVKSGGTSVVCTSWDDACDLQTALSSAHSGDQVWVAAGIYKPTTTDPYPRDATFELESGVAIYGGFSGDELTRDERNWLDHITTLSGDIGTPSNSTDNSFHVVTGSGVDATAILDGFTISGGNANGTSSHYYGGGMYNSINSSPTLTNIIFSTNSASDSGGGMYNYSSSNPSLINVTFSGNSAYAGGGMANNSSSPTLTNVAFSANPATVGGVGGGMFNLSSNPTLINVNFSGNSAYFGGGIYNSYSSPVLNNVTFSGNSATNGGGMYNLTSSNPTLTNVNFIENTATDYGGGMVNWSSSPALTTVNFTENTATDDGGGMYNDASSPALTTVTFSTNSAYYGGGMINIHSSSPTLTNVTFSTNSAYYFGGGMYNYEYSSPTLTNVTFSNNTASTHGGGMYNYFYSGPTLTNVTFTENSATNSGGGIYSYDYSSPNLTNVTFSNNTASTHGGGMYNYFYSSPNLTNVTFSNNTASTLGGGMFSYEFSSPNLTNVTFSNNTASTHGGGMYNGLHSSPTVKNSIFWGNGSGQIFDDYGSTTITYSDIEGGFNGEGNINLDPLLSPLANNGGFTQTHALHSGSPAIDKGDPNELNCPPTDQRGYPRPIDGNGDDSPVCDMGAYEFGSSSDGFALTLEIVGSGAVTKSPEDLKYPLGEVVNLTATATPGWTFSSWSGDASGTTNLLSVTMSRHKSITANFTRIYKLYLPLILKN